jgi:hypothetical protein
MEDVDFVQGPVRCAGVDQLEKDTPEVPERAKPIDRANVAARIWSPVMERLARRLRLNDERFENAAKDAFEAADCFLIKARGHSPEVVDAALAVWPAIWCEYHRGALIKNFQLAIDTAEIALNAAKVFVTHGQAVEG